MENILGKRLTGVMNLENRTSCTCRVSLSACLLAMSALWNISVTKFSAASWMAIIESPVNRMSLKSWQDAKCQSLCL